MSKKDIGKMSVDFMEDFNLRYEDLRKLVPFHILNPQLRGRVEMLDEIRRKMKDLIDNPEDRYKELWKYNENLSESYFDAICNGRAGEVLVDFKMKAFKDKRMKKYEGIFSVNVAGLGRRKVKSFFVALNDKRAREEARTICEDLEKAEKAERPEIPVSVSLLKLHRMTEIEL